jgi:alpha-L-fucosidase
LIELLIEARSKGGSLLLNIGPKPNGAIALEQEDRLRELAAWYFINRESVDTVRPWVITNEKNIWYTASADKKNVYAIITDAAAWDEGDRKNFVLHSVKSTAQTNISVLGQNSLIQEYKPGKDVGCKFQQTDTGLVVSVVKAQRIYDDHKWPNPVVIKIENILPAIDPVQVSTLDARPASTQSVLSGKIFNYSAAKKMKAAFYYRIYNGQTEDLYAGPWTKSNTAVIDENGNFKTTVSGLKKSQRYEFKAIIEYSGIEINGDEKVWQQ